MSIQSYTITPTRNNWSRHMGFIDFPSSGLKKKKHKFQSMSISVQSRTNDLKKPRYQTYCIPSK
ncbi:hypothetical protein Hanom_Chr17g01537651 [Helianthus anomalus]